jgi:hypothetical protein
MIELLDFDTYENRKTAAALANTLHNLGVIDDSEFDCLLADIYERYGDTYGDFGSDDYL